MTSPQIAAPKRNGLAVLWDVIIAPSAAFEELRAVPHWGWAFLLTCVFGMIGGYLQISAGEHVANYLVNHDPRFAAMSGQQLETAKKFAVAPQRFIWLFYPIIAILGILFASLFLLVANAIGRGTGNFARIFALATNVGFLEFGIGYLLRGIIIAMRGPDGFQTQVDMLGVIPSLGWLVPMFPAKLVAMLSTISVIQIWSTVLLALGMRKITGIAPALAWGMPIFMALLFSSFAALNVR